jgi:subtilisin family serine protease
MRTWHSIWIALAGSIALSAFVSSPAGATDPARPRSITVFAGDADAKRPGGKADQLLQRAQQQGHLKVIVGLRFVMRPPVNMPPDAMAKQANALRAMQDRIVRRVFGTAMREDIIRYSFIPYMAMSVDARHLTKLLSDPEVVNIQEDVPLRPADSNTIPIIHADTLWGDGFDGTGYTLAILDTGVDGTHPLLKNKIASGSEACYSANDPEKKIVSLCPGQATSSTADGSGVNCPTTIKECFHGTDVASIAAGAASADNIGVARGAGLIAIQIYSGTGCSSPTDPSTCASVRAYSADILRALQHVLKLSKGKTLKIGAVNISASGGQYTSACDADGTAIKAAIDSLAAAGIPVLIASGNDGYTNAVGYPACVSNAVAIGATDNSDKLASFSNHSSQVKLVGPGRSVKGATPGGGLVVASGTSFSTPLTAGSYAILKQAKPAAGPSDILMALACTGKTVLMREDNSSISPVVPRVDLVGAYDYLLKPPHVSRSWDFSSASQALDWTTFLGTWKVVNGAYRQTPIQANWIGTSTDNCNKSLKISANMVRTDPGTTFFSNSGVMFRTTLDYPGTTISGYWVAYNKCPTNSSGECTGDPDDPPGQAVLWRLDDTYMSGNSGNATLLCSVQSAVHVNALNTVEVEANGPSITYSLNGHQVCAVNDATYIKGPVMAAAYIADPGGHAYALNSMTITSLDATPRSKQPVTLLDPAALMPKQRPAGLMPSGSVPLRMMSQSGQ